jgi:chitodextrinase
VSDFKAVAGAENTTTSFVTLTWTAATTKGKNPVAGYDVYRDGVKTASTAAIVFVDKPLVPSTSYTYYIVTFDAAGNRSLPGVKISATTPAVPNLNVTFTGQISPGILALPKNDITAPSAPANLTATPAALNASSSSVLLSWSASTDDTAVTGYDVYRDGSKISTVTLAGYTDPSVASNVTYVYSVKAFDAAGNRSAASSQVSVKPPSASLGVIVGGQVQPPL